MTPKIIMMTLILGIQLRPTSSKHHQTKSLNHNKIANIERFRTNNSREFWKTWNKHIKNDTIPMNVRSRSGEVSHKWSEVLEIWKRTFKSNLFSNTFSETGVIELCQTRFPICSSEINTLLMNEYIYIWMSWIYMCDNIFMVDTYKYLIKIPDGHIDFRSCIDTLVKELWEL